MQAASLGYGVRRALSAPARNRIRFEMRREVKRARKERKAEDILNSPQATQQMVEDALRVCEEVYAMHARGSVAWASPASCTLS